MHNDDYFTMVKKIRLFEAVRSIEALLAGPVDRSDFIGSAATVNAWYQVSIIRGHLIREIVCVQVEISICVIGYCRAQHRSESFR